LKNSIQSPGKARADGSKLSRARV